MSDSVTGRFYLLVSFIAFYVVVKAQQPAGYLGCFDEYDGVGYGIMLINGIRMYEANFNHGEYCKTRCRGYNKRYAGTKRYTCLCSSDIVKSVKMTSTTCYWPCPGSPTLNEKCGGSGTISLYDTWPCITDPCKNGARCKDINAEHYICYCSVGWRGRVCNETVSKPIYTHLPSFSAEGIGSSTTAQPSNNRFEIYIGVPVAIIVVIVLGLTTFLILRKKRSRIKNDHSQTCRNSENTSRKLFAVANNTYNDHEIIPLETSVNVNETEEHIANVITGNSDNNYNSIGQLIRSDVQNNESEDVNVYGHLNTKSTPFFDPTYSHTTVSRDATDYTYSHMNQSGRTLDWGLIAHVDHDTYNTCSMNGDAGKLRSDQTKDDTDDTYNKHGVHGKAMNVCKKNTISNLNEPDYDHI